MTDDTIMRPWKKGNESRKDFSKTEAKDFFRFAVSRKARRDMWRSTVIAPGRVRTI